MARLNLTRPAAFTFGLAVIALSFAACGKHSSSTPTPTATATVTPPVSPAPSASPCTLTLGLAYEPDGGNGNGFHGVQVTHFQANDENLCAAAPLRSTPAPVNFQSSVGGLAFSTQATEGVALLQGSSGNYNFAQAVFGALVGQLVPAGAPYDLSVQPSPVPTGINTPVPIIPNVTGIAILDQSASGNFGAGLAVGPGANPSAIVQLTSLINAPIQYGNSIPFSGSNYTDKSVLPGPYSVIRVSPDQTNVLVRGPSALETFAVSTLLEFNAITHDATLGYGSGPNLRGNGKIAYDPADSTRALLGGTTATANTQLTLITGLPTSITKASTLLLPGNINSIYVLSNGVYALVATDAGIVVVSGVNSGTLGFVTPFLRYGANTSAIPYVDCNGTARKMSDVFSVGISAGTQPNTTNNFLVALGMAPGVACPSGYDATIAAIPFNTALAATPAPSASPTPAPTASPSPGATAAPTPSPIPTLFYQNNVIPPPPGADYLIVR